MKIPGFNLWNWPTQKELESINADKAELKRIENNIKRAISDSEWNTMFRNAMSKRIKEREFLYYLRSGRFPE